MARGLGRRSRVILTSQKQSGNRAGRNRPLDYLRQTSLFAFLPKSGQGATIVTTPKHIHGSVRQVLLDGCVQESRFVPRLMHFSPSK